MTQLDHIIAVIRDLEREGASEAQIAGALIRGGAELALRSAGPAGTLHAVVTLAEQLAAEFPNATLGYLVRKSAVAGNA